MFRKKQTPDQTGRNVRPQQTANVFSYYASRSSAEGGQQQSRRMEPLPQKRRSIGGLRARQLVAYTPSFIAGLVLMICLVYVSTLEIHPKLQVVGDQRTTGLVSGIETYEDDIGAVLGDSVLNRSKLLINTDDIARKIQEKFPELGEVAVILPLVDRRPIVQVQPAKPALVLGTLEGGLVIDENGRTIADARDVESSVRDALPTLQDESGLSLERGKYAVPKETVGFVQAIAAQLKQKGYKIQSMTLPAAANEMHLRVHGKPYYVKFDLRGDSRVQAGTFIATKEKLEADKVTPREYIDARVPGKAYFK
jgi:hypothetical protein